MNDERTAENDAPQCHGPIPVEHALGVFPDHCSACAEYDGPRRRNETEARRCSQNGCPGDGRYQPPGKGHLPGCHHDAVKWVWETVIPPASSDTDV
jgi:hypothetical protein